ncbi:hypothetical protein [Burkholderia sola]|uniref:hypothetical protein n=1 Tax=Burkholderia sola TaxID=2843302 RepID=UPI0023DDFC82|nr:hypothetical protein [Burkholderia sola]MDF3081463.1 hypothetical protein [Burkholderia sola]
MAEIAESSQDEKCIEPDGIHETFDFSRSIDDLRRRAKGARLFRSAIAAILVTVVLVGVTVVFQQYSGGERFGGFRNLLQKMETSTDYRPSQVFLLRVDNILSNLYPSPLSGIAYKMDTGKDAPPVQFTVEDRTNQLKAVDALVGFYERTEKAQATNKVTPQNDSFTPAISTLAFSAGAVVIAILLIQIMVTFMRYYAQLAELYDAQALALEASNGKAEIAIKFAEHFSPNSITFGKLPTTLYEKSLDTIAELARAKLKS